MSKIDIKVYVLPTEKATEIWVGTPELGIRYGKPGTAPFIKYYHLYATTSEPPKEGDWCYSSMDMHEEIRKFDGEHWDTDRKVVATDDKDLQKAVWKSGDYEPKTPFQEISKGIPPISPEFQQAWVREANNKTPIVDAMMEMENIDKNHFTDMLPHWVIGKPKLNPQGCVTILPISKEVSELERLKVALSKALANNSKQFSEGFKAGEKSKSILPVKEKMYTKIQLSNNYEDTSNLSDKTIEDLKNLYSIIGEAIQRWNSSGNENYYYCGYEIHQSLERNGFSISKQNL